MPKKGYIKFKHFEQIIWRISSQQINYSKTIFVYCVMEYPNLALIGDYIPF